ncbi:Somatostatin receptor type 2 [Bulinus truncatus]|nr:Somatostatin receptor type 2 [Bulinus truncatus]
MESYMAIPVDQWGSDYLVATLGDSVYRLHECSKERLQNPHFHMAFGVRIRATSPVGVISGSCADEETNFAIEMAFPTKFYRLYDFFTFCQIWRGSGCYLIVSSMVYAAEFNLTAYENLTTTLYTVDPYTRFIKLDNAVGRVRSYTFVQVVIVMVRAPYLSENYGSTALCTVIPTDLFSVDYRWMTPNYYAGMHHMAIIITNEYFRNIFLDSISIDRLGRPVMRHRMDVWFVFFYILSDKLLNHRSHSVGFPIGCYAYGVHKSLTTITPVGYDVISKEVLESVFDQYTHPPKGSITLNPNCSTFGAAYPSDNRDNDCDGKTDEEIKNFRDDDADGLVDEDIGNITDRGCPHGWFGAHCDNACRCLGDQCTSTGRCRENVTCSLGYFGTHCQYKDAMFRSNVSQSEVKSRHYLKCHKKFSAISPIKIKLRNKIRFTMIQIEAPSAVHYTTMENAYRFQDVHNISSFDMTTLELCGLNSTTTTPGPNNQTGREISSYLLVLPYVIVVTYILICIMGLVGNGLVIYVVLMFAKMKTVTNMYILNLALSDILFLTMLPILAATAIVKHWIFGFAMCKIYFVMYSINLFGGAFNLCIMSADRYMAVCHPIRSLRYRTPRIALFLCLCIWSLAFLVMMPIILYSGTQGNKYFNGKYTCTIRWPENQAIQSDKAFIWYSFILGFAIPVSLISVFYVLVIVRLRQVGPAKKSKEKRKSHRRVTRLVLTVISVYIVCWLPYWVFQVCLVFKDIQNSSEAMILLMNGFTILSYANSMLNPFLYAFLSDNFRKSFVKAFKCVSSIDAKSSVCNENSVFPRTSQTYTRSGTTTEERMELSCMETCSNASPQQEQSSVRLLQDEHGFLKPPVHL